MNERMKIIVKKAHEYADQHWREDGYPFFEEYHQVFSNNYQQKFAELIVQECYETIKKDMELAHIQLIPIDFGIYANGRLRRIIKEHFGVE
jgi:hypothetical protein